MNIKMNEATVQALDELERARPRISYVTLLVLFMRVIGITPERSLTPAEWKEQLGRLLREIVEAEGVGRYILKADIDTLIALLDADVALMAMAMQGKKE